MFDAVLVAVSPDDGHRTGALETAVVLADAVHCPVEVVTVIPPGGVPVDLTGLEAELERLDGGGVDLRMRTVVGVDPSAAVLRLQRESPGTQVCLGTRAHTGLGELVLGSVAAAVVRGASRPILLVGPNAGVPPRFDSVDVCLDGTAAAHRAAAVAGVWAFELGATLELLHVAPPTVTDPSLDSNELRGVAADLRTSLGVHPSWEVLHGEHPAAAIVDHAREHKVALLALTTPTHAVRAARVLGSTAMRVVHTAPCPVLVVPVPIES
jgi:nucleotide-binding universal stress UspA family protein